MTPIFKIPHSKPDIGQLEQDYVRDVLQSNMLMTGACVPKFMQAFLASLNVPYGVATQSGSSAIQLALAVLGIAPGDEVIVPVYICDSVWHAVRAVGAIPVPVDNAPGSCNPSCEEVLGAITHRTRAILVAHIMGYPFPIEDLRRSTQLPIIEDASQALGSMLLEKPLGTFGDIAIFSFSGTKMITGGTGGFLATSHEAYGQRALQMHNSNDGVRAPYVKFSYAMNELQAGLLLAQMERFQAMLERRARLTDLYDESLAGTGFARYTHANTFSFQYNNYRFLIPTGKAVDRILQRLHALGISCRRPIDPLYVLHEDIAENQYPNAVHFHDSILSIPIYPALTDIEAAYVAHHLHVMYSEEAMYREDE